MSIPRSALILPLVLLAGLGAAAKGDKSVEVDSDRLEIDHRARTARFEGNVKATYGDLVLTCSSLSAVYGEDGAVLELDAKGPVTVVRKEARATAGHATLDAARGLLVLSGSPRIVRGPHTLSGKKITVNLETGEIRVLEARGKFRLGPAGS